MNMKTRLMSVALSMMMATAAHADWRSPGKSLHGGPEGAANSLEMQQRARLEEAVRNGTAGYAGNTSNTYISTTTAGCLVMNTITATKAADADISQTVKCTNTGDQTSTNNVGGKNSTNGNR